MIINPACREKVETGDYKLWKDSGVTQIDLFQL